MRRGLPIVDGISGYDWIGCTAELYSGGSDMNYGVMKTVFGDTWVGKTGLEPNGVGVFATWEDAQQAAFDTWPSEENRFELEDALEEEAETIHKDMEKFIIT